MSQGSALVTGYKEYSLSFRQLKDSFADKKLAVPTRGSCTAWASLSTRYQDTRQDEYGSSIKSRSL